MGVDGAIRLTKLGCPGKAEREHSKYERRVACWKGASRLHN